MTIYVVQPGDTLYTIARQHDVPVQRIVSDNGLHEPSPDTWSGACDSISQTGLHGAARGYPWQYCQPFWDDGL